MNEEQAKQAYKALLERFQPSTAQHVGFKGDESVLDIGNRWIAHLIVGVVSCRRGASLPPDRQNA